MLLSNLDKKIKYEKLLKTLNKYELFRTYSKDLDISDSNIYKHYEEDITLDNYLYIGKKNKEYYFFLIKFDLGNSNIISVKTMIVKLIDPVFINEKRIYGNGYIIKENNEPYSIEDTRFTLKEVSNDR